MAILHSGSAITGVGHTDGQLKWRAFEVETAVESSAPASALMDLLYGSHLRGSQRASPVALLTEIKPTLGRLSLQSTCLNVTCQL